MPMPAAAALPAATRDPEQPAQRLERDPPAAEHPATVGSSARKRDAEWLETMGACWVDGRAAPAEERGRAAPPDVVDLALDLANFAAESAQAADRTSSGLGGVVDRKPHKQRMSVDLGGQLNDKGANTRLGGKHTQAMLNGRGSGARGLRRWWEVLDEAVRETCAGSQLIQMFPIVATGQGLGAVTGEPHADAASCRVTYEPPPRTAAAAVTPRP